MGMNQASDLFSIAVVWGWMGMNYISPLKMGIEEGVGGFP
jgi:hypothetical protein